MKVVLPLHIPWQICSIEQYLDFSGKHPGPLQSVREGCSYTHIHHCLLASIRSLSEKEQCQVNKTAQNVPPQDGIRARVILVETP